MSAKPTGRAKESPKAGQTGAFARPGLVGVLDVGASKTVCFIGRPGETPRAATRIVGVGHQLTRGLRAGRVVDLDATEMAVRRAVEQAERMAGASITGVTLNYCGPSLRSKKIRASIGINGREVTDRDVKRVFRTAMAMWQVPNYALLHAIPQGYSVDGNADVRDPRGMFATQLGIEMCVVYADPGPLNSLAQVVDRCRLDLRSILAAPYAAGLAALVDDEMHLGATVIDIGAGSTSYAVFYDGALVHLGAIPCGGQHVTNDIARGLSTPLSIAERIKSMHGTVLDGPDDDFDMIDCPGMCDDPGLRTDQTPRAVLTGVIRPRMEEILELVRAQLQQSGMYRDAGERVVLVGGGSQLDGTRELAARILHKQVRLGRPLRLTGLGDAVNGAGFAAIAGTLHHVISGPGEAISGVPDLGEGTRMYRSALQTHPVGRLWHWLRDNF